MKRLIWGSLLIAIISFMIWSRDPLNDVVNFIIAGSIPRTNVSIGFWSTLLLAAVLLWLTYRGLKRQQQKIIEHHAVHVKAEQAKKEFEDSNKIEFDKSKRSVIAARTPDPILK